MFSMAKLADMANEHIRAIAQKVGGVVALSKAIGLSRTAVSQWTRVPAERIAAVERITGVPRHQLRPDLYPDADWLPEELRQKVEAA